MQATHASRQADSLTQGDRRRLARPIDLERVWTPDREAMLAALRVVLDLPRQLPERGPGGSR
jgi:hypothetical protein